MPIAPLLARQAHHVGGLAHIGGIAHVAFRQRHLDVAVLLGGAADLGECGSPALGDEDASIRAASVEASGAAWKIAEVAAVMATAPAIVRASLDDVFDDFLRFGMCFLREGCSLARLGFWR